MANSYTKSMRDALKEARDYRDASDIEELDIEILTKIQCKKFIFTRNFKLFKRVFKVKNF